MGKSRQQLKARKTKTKVKTKTKSEDGRASFSEGMRSSPNVGSLKGKGLDATEHCLKLSDKDQPMSRVPTIALPPPIASGSGAKFVVSTPKECSAVLATTAEASTAVPEGCVTSAAHADGLRCGIKGFEAELNLPTEVEGPATEEASVSLPRRLFSAAGCCRLPFVDIHGIKRSHVRKAESEEREAAKQCHRRKEKIGLVRPPVLRPAEVGVGLQNLLQSAGVLSGDFFGTEIGNDVAAGGLA